MQSQTTGANANGFPLPCSDEGYYKLTVSLDVIYIHIGNEKDYPLRLIITSSHPFLPCGKDVDVMVNQQFGNFSGDFKGKD